MKKLVCLIMVALIGTAASAASVFLIVDPADASPDWGSTITVNLVGEGFVPPAQGFGQLVIASISGEGTASNPRLHESLLYNFPSAGTLVNDNDTLIRNINGAVNMGDMVGVVNGVAAFSFELTLPDVPGFYCYRANGVVINSNFGEPIDIGEVAPFCIFPEPMTIALLSLGGLFIRRRK